MYLLVFSTYHIFFRLKVCGTDKAYIKFVELCIHSLFFTLQYVINDGHSKHLVPYCRVFKSLWFLVFVGDYFKKYSGCSGEEESGFGWMSHRHQNMSHL